MNIEYSNTIKILIKNKTALCIYLSKKYLSLVKLRLNQNSIQKWLVVNFSYQH